MRRPRGGDERSSPLPGGAGAPPGGTTTPCEELADGGPRGLPEVRKERLTQKAPRVSSRRQGETDRQKARPGAAKTPPWRAERRPRSPKGNAARRKDWCAARCAIPSRFEGARLGPAKAGRKTAYPGPLK